MNAHCKIGKVTPKIASVTPMPYPVNASAVEILEYALEQAKTGEFRTVAIACINARSYVHTAFSMDYCENPVLLSGAINWVGQRVMDEVFESV